MSIDDVRHPSLRIRSKPATVIGAAPMLALRIAPTTAMFTLVVIGVLMLTTAASTWRPARQAAPVDPAKLLRSE